MTMRRQWHVVGGLALVAASAGAGGCAAYKVTPVSHKAVMDSHSCCNGDKGGPEGYVVYAPKLFLLATRTPVEAKKGEDGAANVPPAYTVTPMWLPDYSRPYRVTTEVFLAKGNFKFTFKDGWQLVGVETEQDSTAALAALSGLVQSAIAAAKPAASASEAGSGPPDFHLYSVEFKSGQYSINKVDQK